MRIVSHQADTFILNLERGEEFFEKMKMFLKEQHISTAHFTGLGAADQLDLAYYNLSTKEFERHPLNEEVEILSLVGNVALLHEEILIHCHGVFGRRDLSTFGGHLFQLRVSGACEIHLVCLSGKATRAFDEATGLNLLCQITT